MDLCRVRGCEKKSWKEGWWACLCCKRADFEGDEDEEDARAINGNTVLWREEMHKRYQQEQLMAEIHARTLAANGDYGKVKTIY